MGIESTDLKFPIIDLRGIPHAKERGLKHGKELSTAIKELCQIRKELMFKKNKTLVSHFEELARQQLEWTKNYHFELYEELCGISEGSSVSLEQICLLNNYTDFRDIMPEDQGCSTIYAGFDSQRFAGQTWDMHFSATYYTCLILLDNPNQILFSIAGCVGMMGVNEHNLFIGVNNLNGKQAVPRSIWPVIVRQCLLEQDYIHMRNLLLDQKVTSAHNYLIASDKDHDHLEIFPNLYASSVLKNQLEQHLFSFHTNHCLEEKTKNQEEKLGQNSTSLNRFNELEKHSQTKIESIDMLYNILTSHEGYPKSICSHFQANSQDPSMTCGGAVYDFQTRIFKAWRGCPHEGNLYKEIIFDLKELK